MESNKMKDNNKILPLLLLLTVVMFFSACDDSEKQQAAKEKLMRDEFQFRLDSWNYELERVCKEKAMTRAIAIVDSILIATARGQRDTMAKYFIPERPVRPEFQEDPDTLQVKPLLNVKKDSVKD